MFWRRKKKAVPRPAKVARYFDCEDRGAPLEECEEAIRRLFRRGGLETDLLMVWLEDQCKFWESTLVPGDPVMTAALESRRALLLELKGIIEDRYRKENENHDV